MNQTCHLKSLGDQLVIRADRLVVCMDGLRRDSHDICLVAKDENLLNWRVQPFAEARK